jgi:hypothetical protein
MHQHALEVLDHAEVCDPPSRYGGLWFGVHEPEDADVVRGIRDEKLI